MLFLLFCHALLSLSYIATAIPFPFYNPCYDKKSAPVYCSTEFINPISTYKLPVKVTETCGRPTPVMLCQGNNGEACERCRKKGQHSHPPSYLTDLHNPKNVTCWKSNPFEIEGNKTGFQRNVTLTLSLKKRYQLYYFVMRFCTKPPETMIIYKSKDHRKKWIPYQYYSSRCRSGFNMEPGFNLDRPGASCTEEFYDSSPGPNGVIINLSPNNSGKDMAELTEKEYEWASVTDIKVVMMHPNFRPKANVNYFKNTHTSGRNLRSSSNNRGHFFNPMVTGLKKRSSNKNKNPTLIQINPAIYYGISDITMGGRCQCNGHASRCKTERGKLVCDCAHNTAGPDCDRCKPFHFDVPWQRATKSSANACVACNCNVHARRCQFDENLYLLSGNVSGGVCVKCRHNTSGRFCHYCKEGYYRNPNKLLIHRKACLPCKCNVMGSAGMICNHTTGQCPCKDHATGLRCQKCEAGYQQTGSPVAPCIEIAPTRPAPEPVTCPTNCQIPSRVQLRRKKFCRKSLVYEASVINVADEGKWIRYNLKVTVIYKKTSRFRRGIQVIRIRKDYVTTPCNCVKLKLRAGRKYIIFSSYSKPLLLDPRDTVLPCRDSYKNQLKKLKLKKC